MKDTRPADQIAAQLRDPGTTRTEALTIVVDVKGARLAELARLLHIPTRGLKADDVRNRIVDATVGARLGHAAVLTYPSDRPIPADATHLRPVPAYARRLPAAADLRALTAAIEGGEVTDPAVLADLADAAQALVAVASRAAASGAVNAKAATDARTVALAAIRSGEQPSGWTAITTVRTALADLDLDRDAQDALLIGMLRDGLVHPIPVSNLKALTPADDAAALRVGGQLAHAIQAC